MKILITGADGQLGQSIRKIAPNHNHEFTFTDIEELNVTIEEEIDNYLKSGQFDFLINCAAYTAVDNAENDYDKALALNTTAPYLLAKYAKKYKTRFIHISTDYVFDGKSSVPYSTKADTNPKSIYGITKLQGEKKILRCNKDAKIIRTSWLYGEFGHNFVKTILKLGQMKSSLNVVFDQVGTPTYATDLARAVLKMTEHMPIDSVFHFSDEGVCSWYDFAKKIVEIKGFKCKVLPVLSKEFPTIAQRPYYSVLDKSDIKFNLRIEIPHWEDSLRQCLEILQ